MNEQGNTVFLKAPTPSACRALSPNRYEHIVEREWNAHQENALSARAKVNK